MLPCRNTNTLLRQSGQSSLCLRKPLDAAPHSPSTIPPQRTPSVTRAVAYVSSHLDSHLVPHHPNPHLATRAVPYYNTTPTYTSHVLYHTTIPYHTPHQVVQRRLMCGERLVWHSQRCFPGHAGRPPLDAPRPDCGGLPRGCAFLRWDVWLHGAAAQFEGVDARMSV